MRPAPPPPIDDDSSHRPRAMTWPQRASRADLQRWELLGLGDQVAALDGK